MIRSIVGVGLAISLGVAPQHGWAPCPQSRLIQLTSSDTAAAALGNGTAFVMGGSGLPLPPQRYVDTADALFLRQNGFTGTSESLFTPQLFYPIGFSETRGAALLTEAITDAIGTGRVDAANPVVVFGYSQSAAMSSLTMTDLQRAAIPSDLVRFVFIGNSANPNGGMAVRFDIPAGSNWSLPTLNLMLGNPTPNLYPADVYTLEYDGFADFPRYPLNLLSVANAFVGMLLQHMGYLGLTPERIANAIPLETTADAITRYYMIPAETLPLLDVLRLQPITGDLLADLLEPALRILVNLGYGSIEHGWSDGPADVPVTADLFSLYPADLDWSELSTALVKAAQEGMRAATADLFDPATYQMTSIFDNPVFATLWDSLYGMGLTSIPLGALDAKAASAEGAGGFTEITRWLSDLQGLQQPDFDAIGAT